MLKTLYVISIVIEHSYSKTNYNKGSTIKDGLLLTIHIIHVVIEEIKMQGVSKKCPT